MGWLLATLPFDKIMHFKNAYVIYKHFSMHILKEVFSTEKITLLHHWNYLMDIHISIPLYNIFT